MTTNSLPACSFQDWGMIEYNQAWQQQETFFLQAVKNKTSSSTASKPETTQDNTLIFCQHPHVYTLGKSGSQDNLLIDHLQLQAHHAQFVRTNRGGDITYHGPGQLVGYPILDLEQFKISLKDYIHCLEETIIRTLAEYGITASRLAGATGVWLEPENPHKARKICAIGVKSSRYITMHGFALNINTDLNYFSYINPCGFTEKGVTSLAQELGEEQDFQAVSARVKEHFKHTFNLQWV